MIRVAFVITDLEWLGGVNYYRSLFHALSLQPGKPVEPVIITPSGMSARAKATFVGVEVLSTSALTRKSLIYFIRKGLELLFSCDYVLGQILARHKIALCSHGPPLGKKSRIPSLVWIPDFQHLYLPHFFSKNQIDLRNRLFRKMIKRSRGVIVSSQSARADLAAFAPSLHCNVHVMHFVPQLPACIVPLASLQEKYAFVGPYIFLPNQFWAHKNHITVIQAFRKLKKSGLQLQLICTGALQDARNPDHYNMIKESLAEEPKLVSFHVLGVVPFDDMVSFMFHSKALINPSLFEGWSTTVEEAKLLGKDLVLSDLPVHREQGGGDAIYFAPLAIDECASALESAWLQPAKIGNLDYVEKNLAESIIFGERYLQIVKEIISI